MPRIPKSANIKHNIKITFARSGRETSIVRTIFCSSGIEDKVLRGRKMRKVRRIDTFGMPEIKFVHGRLVITTTKSNLFHGLFIYVSLPPVNPMAPILSTISRVKTTINTHSIHCISVWIFVKQNAVLAGNWILSAERDAAFIRTGQFKAG